MGYTLAQHWRLPVTIDKTGSPGNATEIVVDDSDRIQLELADRTIDNLVLDRLGPDN